MQYQFFQAPTGSGAHRLLIHFCGWAMTPASVASLSLPSDCDLLVVYDYRSLLFTPPLSLARYRTIVLVAWSLGVWAADRLWPLWSGFAPGASSALVAINGTPYPMHDHWGIPVTIFEATLNSLNEENRTRFNRRMCGGKRYQALFELLSERSTEEIRDELAAVHRLQTPMLEQNAAWTVALLGARDQIFPLANMQAFWAAHEVPAILLEHAYHYLFDCFDSWQELLQCVHLDLNRL